MPICRVLSVTVVYIVSRMTSALITAATPMKTRTSDRDAKADCFYVYPTISRDPDVSSDLVPGLEEQATAAVQAARFGSVCRPLPQRQGLDPSRPSPAPHGAGRPVRLRDTLVTVT